MARPRTTRTGIAAAWLIGTALALTACSGEDPEPVFADPPATEPTATPEPTESAEPERETPRQFIRRWYKAEEELQNTGDPTAYLKMTKDCEPCQEAAHRISGYYEAGGYIKWQGRVIKKFKHLGNNVYDIWVESAPSEYKLSSSDPVEQLEGGPDKLQVILVEEDEEYFVVETARRPL